MFKNFLFIIILYSFLMPKYANEQLIYDVEIKGLSFFTGAVGECIINFNTNDENQYELTVTIQTTNFAKRIFPYFDSIEMLLEKNLSLLEMKHLIVSKNKKESFSKVEKAQKSILFNNQLLDFYKDTLFTPYSLIYYLRNTEMNENDEFEYQIYDSGKLKDVKLKINSTEKIKVPLGSFECFNLTPIQNQNLVKNKGMLELWYTNNSQKIPVQIKLNSKIGTFIMKLKKINKK
tara:strand:+ start:954 stop:1652 length:699 start_codon:yes stop_codon:yes gene_type:complete